jgi:hypothetical protein
VGKRESTKGNGLGIKDYVAGKLAGKPAGRSAGKLGSEEADQSFVTSVLHRLLTYALTNGQ